MAGAAGPNTAESGLVFAYDLGNTLTSYIGEPTTNEANTNYSRTIQFHNQGTYGNAGYILDAPERGPDWKKIIVTDRGNNFRIAQFPYISQNYGTTKVYSVEYDFGGTSGYFIYGDGSSGFGVLQDNGKRVTALFTPPSAGSWSEALFLGNNTPASGIYDIIYYRNYQVEVNSHPTQFTPSSRSATQGLLPLVNNSTIDITNVSFNSNAEMIFDGTNDTISVNSYPAIELVDNVSVEYVYKRLSTNPILDVIANKYHSTGWELFCTTANTFALAGRNGDGTYYSTSNAAYTMQNNQYYHLVAIKEGLSWRLYVNGELYSYLTANTVGTWSNNGILQIGGEGNGYYPNMELPILKIYNQVLTALEIQQNFQALRYRFGI
jgi:hypothetical protein